MNNSVFLQLGSGVKLLLALLALLRLDALRVLPVDVTGEILPAAKYCLTEVAD